MFKVTGLSAHPYRRVQIKRQFLLLPGVVSISSSSKARTSRFGFNETVQTGNILEFGVGVQEEGCMIGISQPRSMEFLQVSDEVVDSLSVEELGGVQSVSVHTFPDESRLIYLSNHVAWLNVPDSLDKLFHRTVVVSFRV